MRLKFKPQQLLRVPKKDHYFPMKSLRHVRDLQGQVKQASIPDIPRIRSNVKPEILEFLKKYIYFENILLLSNKDLF